MAKLEKDIQRELLKMGQGHDKVAMMFRTNSGRVKARGGHFYGCPKGWPDITGFTHNGTLIAIEMKRPDTKGNRNEDQIEIGDLIKESGCVYGVAYDVESMNVILDSIK